MKIVYKFQSEIRIPNVCKSNSNFKIEVRKFELRFTSLVVVTDINCCVVTETSVQEIMEKKRRELEAKQKKMEEIAHKRAEMMQRRREEQRR